MRAAGVLVPHRNLVLAAGLWLLVGLAVAVAPSVRWLWSAAAMAIAGAALADALAVHQRRKGLDVSRDVARALPAGVWQRVQVRLASRDHTLSGTIIDHYPQPADVEGARLPFRLTPGQWVRAGYRLRLLERGAHQFGPVELLLDSPLRLWHLRIRAGSPFDVRVYPDFARIRQYALLATDNRLSQLGLLRRRRRGDGLEFHQLRDYREDDSPRQIDWKASSRHRRLIAREYQDERDQQIVFLLDCGQRMRAKDEALSHFDHALNALLLLAYVALRQGDAVGLATFAHPSPRFIAPRKSIATVPALLNAVYDLQPTLQTADYVQAAEDLARRVRRRALIVLATTTREEDDEALRRAVRFLGRRHVVILASLREAILDEVRQTPIRGFEDALLYAAGTDYVQARERQLGILRQSGVHVLDVQPGQLPPRLVNQYWEIKRAGVI